MYGHQMARIVLAMNNPTRTITRRVLAFAFITAALIGADHGGPRTVNFARTAPCSACGHATPVTITCEGIDWNIYEPGPVQDIAPTICPAGSTYTWKAMR